MAAEVRGRVFGAVLGGVLVAAPAGMIVLGALTDARGPHIGMAVAGIAFVAVGGCIAALRTFRGLDGASG